MALAVKGQCALQAHCETSSEKSMNGNVYSQVVGSIHKLYADKSEGQTLLLRYQEEH